MPIDVTELGMVILFKLLQPEKAALPMEMTELGMVTLVRPLHSSNESSPIDVTLYDKPLWVMVVGMVTWPEYSFE